MREITLYRLPIVRAAGRRSRLRHVVHETLLHELGHLFGMTERDLDEYTIVAKHCADAAELAGPVALAVSKAVANVVRHAYRDGRSGPIELEAHRLDVLPRGAFQVTLHFPCSSRAPRGLAEGGRLVAALQRPE